MDYAMNDKVMKQMMIDDIMENYEYTVEEAEAWVKEHGDGLIGEMWDGYSNYMEANAEYKGEDDG